MHHSFPTSCRPGLPLAIVVALGIVPAARVRAGDQLPPARSHLQPVSEMARSPATGPGLGVSLSRATTVLRQQLALKRGAGLVIDQVATGSRAEAAGFLQHDVLVRLDDQLLLLPQQFDALLEASEPDDPLECTVLRSGREVTISLGRKPAPPVQAFQRPTRRPLRPADSALAIVQPVANLVAAPVAAAPGQLAEETLVRQDADYAIRLSRGDKTRLVVSDPAGGVVFEGPIDDPEIRRHVPAAVRDRVTEMERLLEPRPAVTDRPATPTVRPVAEIGRLDIPPVELRE
jgi:hypothetical protein